VTAVTLVCGCRSGEGRTEPSAAAKAASFVRSEAADSIVSLGESVYKRGEYDSALVILETGLQRALADGDSSTVARSLTWQGLAHWKQGSYDSSKTIGERALAMKQRLGLKADLFRSYNALGLLAHAEGRLTDAEALFAKAHAAASAVNDSVSIAKAVGNLGLVHADAGQFDKARTEFKTLADAAHRSNDSTAEGNALANLGMLEARSGDASAAIEWLNKARKAYGEPEAAQEENLLGQLGIAYSDLGETQQAMAYMDSALRVAHSHGLKLQESEDLQVYAQLLGDAGDHQRALDFLGRAKAIGLTIGAEGRTGEIEEARARELTLVQRYDLAAAAMKNAIAIHRAGGFRLEELRDHLMLAEIAQLSHRTADAQRALRAADSLATTLNLEIAAENVSLVHARVADIAGDPAAVLRALPAQATFPRMGPAAQGESFALRARAFARLDQWPEAVVSGRQAVQRLEGLRLGIGEGPLRSTFVSEQSAAYADLAVALLRLGRTSEAFEVADAARGKSLLEHIAALARDARTTTTDLAESQQLLRRIDWLTERLRLADTIPAPDRANKLRLDLRELSSRLAEARREYEDRIKRVAVKDPRSATLIGVISSSAAAIRGSLTPSDLLIEYTATPNGLLIFAITRDTVVSVETRTTVEDLASRVRVASELASRQTGSGNAAVFRSLYGLLIGPVEHVVQLARYPSLIIVPHAVLSYVPFSALTAPNGQYLVENHSIALLPSASALPHLRDQRATANDASANIFAPFPEQLPGSRAEAVAVNKVVHKPTSFVGGRATESRFRESLGRVGIAHVASHAELNPTNPMFSHVELARGPGNNPADDGRFEVHELLRISVNSSLVFLSGCETGAGTAWSTSFRRSQDYATLSQAFLYSGARDVVATLWRIDDVGASVFAGHFYRELASRPAADALAATQRWMMRQPKYSAPRYWAAYFISGAGGAPSRAQKSGAQSVQLSQALIRNPK
jgi:CHAT domain-containing protein